MVDAFNVVPLAVVNIIGNELDVNVIILVPFPLLTKRDAPLTAVVDVPEVEFFETNNSDDEILFN